MAEPTQTSYTTTSIPDYARPYVDQMLGMTGGSLYNYEYQDANGKIVPQGTPGSTMVYRNASGAIVPAGTPGAQPAPLGLKKYETYPGERTAAFNDLQTNKLGTGAFDQAAKLGYNTYSTSAATGLEGLAKLAGQTSYSPTTFDYKTVTAPATVVDKSISPITAAKADKVTADTIAKASMLAPTDVSGFGGSTKEASTKSFIDKGTAASYMSPYTQNVVDIQQREAQRQADIAGTQRNAQAAQAGAFGGSRQAIMNAEAARNLATQKGDIQAQGSNAAFQQAQQQFNAEQGYGLTAQQANLQAGLQSALANQQTGLSTGIQNLSADQQTRVQNAANNLQASGMSAQQALQAALANQQTDYNVGAQNLAAQLNVQQLKSSQDLQAQLANQAAYQQKQQLAEQSKQFGAGLGLQGLQAGMQGYQNLGNIGQNLYGQNISNINTQAQFGAQQQQQAQNILDQKYQDFQAQKQEPFQQLSYMSNMLRGVPLSQGAQTVYQAPPSAFSQVAGAGLTLAGMSNLFGGKSNAKGGVIKEKKRKPAGLPALVLSKMG